MVNLYKAERVFDARKVYDLWLRLVQEEDLYDAMLDERLEAVAEDKGLDGEALAILEDFRVQPGTVWHVENLRFRCVTMVSRMLSLQLPATTHALTGGNREWLRDLVYAYMARNRWVDLGHHRRFAECERFVEHVRRNLLKGRRPPDHIEDILHYELATIELMRNAVNLPSGGEDAAEPDDNKRYMLCELRQRVTLKADVVDWIRRPEGDAAVMRSDGGAEVLLYAVSLKDGIGCERLDEHSQGLLNVLDSPKPRAELAPTTCAKPLVDRWIRRGLLQAV